MGIINRTLDSSEQKESIVLTNSNLPTGDQMVALVPRACTITDVKMSALGISGAPNYRLTGVRFTAGTGGATFAIGSTLAVTAYGTSGYLSYSLPATGSSLLQLQKGDLLVVDSGGSNAAADAVIVEVVVQNIQDIKTWY